MARKVTEVQVEREGSKLVVPEEIPLKVALEAIMLKIREEDEEVSVRHTFDMTIPEGCLSLLHALRELYGFVNPVATPGWFPTPPTFVAVEVGPGKTEQIVWGSLSVPGISGLLQTGIYKKDGAPKFMLVGSVKGKDKKAVQKIADFMREHALTSNVYRGHAISVAFPDPDDSPSMEDYFPHFMTVPQIDESSLIFSEDVQRVVATTLFTPIECTEMCRKHDIPLKRGILLEGPYGVGKTLTATITARKCVENGWTFIHIDDVTKLKDALEFARKYQPAVVFAEDIDQVLSDPNTRDANVNEILNSIDGIDSKAVEILTILTTNNVSNITQAMLRPGRLDTVVPVRSPDAAASVKLIRLFAAQQLAADQDLEAIGYKLAGQIPAVIREVVERSKLGAVYRQKGTDGEVKITALDLSTAADGMMAHMRLLDPVVKEKRESRVIAAETLGNVLVTGVKEIVRGLAEGELPKSNGSHPTHSLPTSDGSRAT